jgi:hypothetical protein
MSAKINKIIHWIIDQQYDSIDHYPNLIVPLSLEFDLKGDCAEEFINTVIEWETDPNTIDSLEELLNKRFPDIV